MFDDRNAQEVTQSQGQHLLRSVQSSTSTLHQLRSNQEGEANVLPKDFAIATVSMTAMRGMMNRSGPILLSMTEKSVSPAEELLEKGGREKEGRPASPASVRVRTQSERSSPSRGCKLTALMKFSWSYFSRLVDKN